ncbi:MAG TPA: efflux RND transporter periplasmic adaptor subunit [Stellaceae bacterium]|nr:efflux RND transporter periplasmic adaptor subunit [Stellaceae bacterium]
MRKGLTLVAVLAVVGAAGWALYAYVSSTRAATETRTAPSTPTIPVTAAPAEARDMPIYIRGIGAVQAYNTVVVKSRVDGQIVKVAFTEGQEVKAGDPLFQIDPRPFQAALEQASANKQKDEAQLVSAQADLQRYTELVGHGYQTRQIYDQQKALVAQLQASIKADQAQIDAAQLNLQYADIRSPIEGRTGARLVDIGNLVRATDNSGLVTITQLRPIFVTFTLPQDQFSRVRDSYKSGTVDVHAFSESDRAELGVGKLTLIDNQIDQTTGTIRLKGTFDNRDEALWPGAFVNVRVVAGVQKNAVTVPARAIQQGPKGSYLFVINPDMTVDMRIVEVTQTEQGVAAIAKGLAAGERVVTDGQYRLEPGSNVRLEPAPSKPDA